MALQFREVGGPKTYLKPSEMKPETVVVTGEFLGFSHNKYGKQNLDFRPVDGGPTVSINHAGHLRYLIDNNAAIGDIVEVTYKGKDVMKSGPYAGKEGHSFKIRVAKSDRAVSETAQPVETKTTPLGLEDLE